MINAKRKKFWRKENLADSADLSEIRQITLREEILARSNFGEFGELPKKFAKFAKISSRQNFFS